MTFKKILTSYKKVKENSGSNLRTEYENSYIDNLKSNFLDNIAYTQVTKNFDYNTTYDVWIFDGDTKDKEVPYKRLLSYPYDTVQFSRGDYINFTYGSESTIWLLTSLESQFIFDVSGRIYRCNETLKWMDSNDELQTYPCVILDELNRGTLDFTSTLTLPTGVIKVLVQYNEDTLNITQDYRFIFKGQAFVVNFVNPFTTGKFITLTMSKDQLSTNDDLINNIAYNSLTVTSSTPTNPSNLW